MLTYVYLLKIRRRNMDFLVIIAVVVLFLVLCGFRIVKQQHEVIVERLGKYHKTMGQV